MPFRVPSSFCRLLEFRRTGFERRLVESTVSSTLTKLRSASCQQNQSITAAVPVIMRIPEMKVGSDIETVDEMLSMSFVIRLIRSPWEWRSMKAIGSVIV